MSMKNIYVGSHCIGCNRTFIIAELSANHNGSLEKAIEGIYMAKKAGADAVKIQTYTPDTITLKSDSSPFVINHGTIWDGRTLYDLYEEAQTPFEWHKDLFDAANECGITIFSSPFDKTAVDLLEKLECPIYKIASPEIIDVELVRYVASKGKPIIISTGIASVKDIERAINICREEGAKELVVLKCTTEYPAPLEKANLNTMKNIANRFGVLAGLSDHTLGVKVPIVSVAMGATVIEKHFIVDKSYGGPDASFSLDFQEFKEMVEAVRETEMIMGKVEYKDEVKDTEPRGLSGRSVFASREIKKGEVFSADNIRIIRPGFGLHPVFFKELLGTKAQADIPFATPLSLSMTELNYD